MAEPEQFAHERRYSYADYLQWHDDKRWELIDGVPYDMTPAPGVMHQRLSGGLFFQFYRFFCDRTCEVFAAPFDVRLPKTSRRHRDIFDVVQPDISVICDPEKLDDRGCIGAPDLVIEVISPGTASKDQVQKRALYERAGVREFWLVHPTDRLVYRYLLHNGAYGKPDIYHARARVTTALFPDLTIDLADVFPPKEKTVCENPPPGYTPAPDIEDEP